MDTRWIRDFIAVSETQSFSRAARRRHLTQPALSRHIRALEMRLGDVSLFDRSTAPIELTDAGVEFKESAKLIIQLLDSAKNKIASYRIAKKNIYITATHSLAVTAYPKLNGVIKDNIADSCVQLIAGNCDDCHQHFAAPNCSFLLCYSNDEFNQDNLIKFDDKLQLGLDWLIPISLADANGQSLHRISSTNIEPVPHLGYAHKSYLGKVLRSHLLTLDYDLNLHTLGESAFADALCAEVMAGLGVAWLPKSLVESELISGRFVIAGGDEFHVPLSINLYKRNQLGTDAIETVWQLLQAVYSQCEDAPAGEGIRRPASVPLS
jgi:DNA-binding transcriptional LysR family regulator